MVRINNNVAYLLGYLAGDGCVKKCLRYKKNGTKGSFCYLINIGCKDKGALIKLRKLFNKEFDITSKWNLKQGNTVYILMIYQKSLYCQLKRRGTYGTKDWRVPNAIKRANKVIKANWLAGFYDAEGSCSTLKLRKQRIIRLSTINKKGMEDVQKLLMDFGIKVNLTNPGFTKPIFSDSNMIYALNVCKKDYINIFNKKIGGFCYRKVFKNSEKC